MILWFDDPAALERAASGGKGASLARLTQWGLPVPPGFVVPVGSLRAMLESNGALADARRLADGDAEAAARELQSRVMASDLPDELERAIVEGYDRLGGAVAVRSSAASEDSAEASFAGQQDTYLDVEGSESVVERVRACAASLFTPRALVYRTQRDAWDDLGIAVVVQRMVPAAKAGVLFTRDPVQGRDHVVVEAVEGSGEALVSGEAVPDHYEMHRESRECVSRFVPRPTPVLTDAELAELTEMGLTVEARFGAPQDIEWAIDDRLRLLQSRPITTL